MAASQPILRLRKKMDDPGKLRELSTHHEEPSRKRGCSNLGMSVNGPPAKKQHSRSRTSSENPELVDPLTTQSNSVTHYCGRTPLDNSTNSFNECHAFDSFRNSYAGLSQYGSRIDTSFTLSPSRTPSPIFSPTSSSTVISNLSTHSEDKETFPSTLADNRIFLDQQRSSVQPTVASSMHIETSTALQPVNAPNTSSASQIPVYLPIDPNLTSSYAMSDTVMTGQEADQLTLPVTANNTFDKESADIFSLNDELRCKIFKEVLLRRSVVHPTYRCGMLKEGPWAPGMYGEMDAGVSELENIDLSLLRVNKQLNKICSEIFYGQKDFVFHDADICRWWMKHIGPQNFSRIRALTLGMHSGFTHGIDGGEPNPFDLSQEEKWHSVLCWMQYRHHLQYLRIHIVEWDDLRWEQRLTDKEKYNLNHHRYEIIHVLQRFRGIETVDITCFQSRWLTAREMRELGLLMQQRKEEMVVKNASKLSLFDLVSQVRRAREQEEEEERWERREQQLARGGRY